MITFACAACQTQMSIGDEFAGRAAVCPKCGSSLIVPGGAPAAAVAPTRRPVRSAENYAGVTAIVVLCAVIGIPLLLWGVADVIRSLSSGSGPVGDLVAGGLQHVGALKALGGALLLAAAAGLSCLRDLARNVARHTG